MKNNKRIVIIALFVIIIIFLGVFDVFDYISINRISEISDFINGFGWLAPLIFIVLYIIATVFFLPGVPLTLLAGIVFGPIFGTIWVSIASVTGATLAFLVSRYIGRDFIVEKFSGSDLFVKLDEGVKKQGWKMVAITRLVAIFPFNAQNYVYGLTNISLKTYVFVSWICMLPGTIAYVFLASAIISGGGSVTKTVTYVGIGLGLILVLSIVSKAIMKKQSINKGGES